MKKSYRIRVKTEYDLIDNDKHGHPMTIAEKNETVKPDNRVTFHFPQIFRSEETLFVQSFWSSQGQFFLEIPEKFVQVCEIREFIPKSDLDSFDFSFWFPTTFDELYKRDHAFLGFAFAFYQMKSLNSLNLKQTPNGVELLLFDSVDFHAE